MTEKDLDSMATVQMKPEYAASEVYSTASEAPPAYKRKSSSVQIARIVAFTIIASSFIIGSFILAAAYLQVRASCDQMQALDSVLEKELMLETLQQELPRAEPLMAKENENELDLQNLDEKETRKTDSQSKQESSLNNNGHDSETDSSFSDSDENEDAQKVEMKVPIELDLSDLAAALFQNNNQKSRMNCVLERKHAEEFVDAASNANLPFGLNQKTNPKRITGERIAIFCESGSEVRDKSNEDRDAEQIGSAPVFIPIQQMPIPYGQIPQHMPLTHMPQRLNMVQNPMMHKLPLQFQDRPQQMQPPLPMQIMQAPRQKPELQIQVQHIPIRELRFRQNFQQLPFPVREISSSPFFQQPSNKEMNQPQMLVQSVPLGEALHRAGITAEDLQNIQRIAEERISDELRRLAADEAAASSSAESDTDNNNSSDADDDSDIIQGVRQPTPSDTMRPPMPDQSQILQIGRAAYGRNLPAPVRIPVPMMQALADDMSNDSTAESVRPHFVHPRSVRSVDNVFKTQRVKRYACNCAC